MLNTPLLENGTEVLKYGSVYINDSNEFSFIWHKEKKLLEKEFMDKMRQMELIEINKQDKLLSNFQTKYQTKTHTQKLLYI
jgi:hypothetical protein